MNRDSLYIKFEELETEMASISPKTELWKKLHHEHEAIGRQLGGQRAFEVIPVTMKNRTARNKKRSPFAEQTLINANHFRGLDAKTKIYDDSGRPGLFQKGKHKNAMI